MKQKQYQNVLEEIAVELPRLLHNNLSNYNEASFELLVAKLLSAYANRIIDQAITDHGISPLILHGVSPPVLSVLYDLGLQIQEE